MESGKNVKACVVDKYGNVRHVCGKARVMICRNLRDISRPHPSIAGKFLPVQVEVYPCQENGITRAKKAAKEAAKKFKKMFAPPQ